MLEASMFIQTIERRQGPQSFLPGRNCLPVRLHLRGSAGEAWIEIRNGYGDYLLQLLHERVF